MLKNLQYQLSPPVTSLLQFLQQQPKNIIAIREQIKIWRNGHFELQKAPGFPSKCTFFPMTSQAYFSSKSDYNFSTF